MLKPEVSIGVGLATAAVVYGVYSTALPSVADVRSLPSQTGDTVAAEKTAAWMSARLTLNLVWLCRRVITCRSSSMSRLWPMPRTTLTPLTISFSHAFRS
jgi:hypothetical protein